MLFEHFASAEAKGKLYVAGAERNDFKTIINKL